MWRRAPRSTPTTTQAMPIAQTPMATLSELPAAAAPTTSRAAAPSIQFPSIASTVSRIHAPGGRYGWGLVQNGSHDYHVHGHICRGVRLGYILLALDVAHARQEQCDERDHGTADTRADERQAGADHLHHRRGQRERERQQADRDQPVEARDAAQHRGRHMALL